MKLSNHILQITLFILYIFSIKGAHTQSLELYHSDTLVNNDTLFIEGDVIADSLTLYIFQGDTTYYYAYEVDVNIDVRNTSGATINVQTKKRHIEIVQSSENYFCWITCFPPFTFQSVSPVPIQTNETLSIYSAHYKPKGKSGSTLVAYTFYDDLDNSDSATVVVEYYMDHSSAVFEGDVAKRGFSKAYPNPVNKLLYFDRYENGFTKYAVHIFNSSGNLVKHLEVTNFETPLQIDVSDLKTGMYLYTISSGATIKNSGKFSKL